MIRVVHFERHRRTHLFSIERVFVSIRAALPNDIAVTTWVCPSRSTGLLARLRDAWAARSNQADVNHVTGDAHYLTWFLDRRRTVLTIHDTESLDRMSGIKQWLFRWLWYRIPIARCAVLVAISKATRECLEQHVPLAGTTVITIPDPLVQSIQRKTGPFHAERPTILHIGTKPNKNLMNHLSALRGLSVRLLVVGHLSQAQEQALAESGLEWENRTNLSDGELAETYREADLLLFASLVEGFGMPILEAQATGIPVITSDCSSLPETAGSGALLVDPTNPEAIRNGLVRVIAEPELRKRLIHAGFENVQRFDPVAIAKEYSHIYRQVAAGASV